MADKRITIQIAATGAPQAAQEIERVEKATKDLDNSTQGYARQSNIAGAAAIGAAAGGAILTEQLRRIREALDSIDIENLRQIAPEMADQASQLQGIAELFSDPLSAIQRVISGTTISEAFGELNDQISRNAEQQSAAIDRLVAGATRTADQIKALANEIRDANRVLDARDSADARRRDAADAARIRAGEDPDVVRADRAAFDRDQALGKINRDQAAQAANVNNLFQNAVDSRTVVGDLERRGASPEDLAEARKKAEQAQKAFEDARREYQVASEIADERRREVRAGFDATVTQAAGNREQRRARERERAEQEAAREAARLEEQVLREQAEAARGQLQGGATVAGRAFNSAGSRVGGRLGGALQGIGSDLANGTDAREIARLQQEFEQATQGLGGATIAALSKMLANLQAATARIEALEGQIKQSRAGK